MLCWPFGTGLPRWASVKACSTKASPMTTPWPRTFSAAPNVSSFICVGMFQAGLLKRIFSPISRPLTICCARILPLTGSLRSLLNCVCVIQLLLKPKDLPHFCDLFHFLRFLLSIFFGKGSCVHFSKRMVCQHYIFRTHDFRYLPPLLFLFQYFYITWV